MYLSFNKIYFEIFTLCSNTEAWKYFSVSESMIFCDSLWISAMMLKRRLLGCIFSLEKRWMSTCANSGE